MRITFTLFRILVVTLASASGSYSQRLHPVNWAGEWNQVKESEGILRVTATLAPGWHIYSQHMEEGGPLPTRLKINSSDDYSLIGTAEEEGNAVTFYDSLYEMDITWYGGEVSFLQRMSMSRMPPEIRGTIHYMVCNDTQCIPQEHAFTVYVDMKN